MDHNKIIIINSKRGEEKVLYQGYAYNLHKKIINIQYWRCVDRKCRGSLKTKNACEIINYIAHEGDHKNYDKNEADYKKHNMYVRALKTNEKPRDIILSELKVTPPLIVKELPELKILRDKITAFRNRNNVRIIDADIPESIKVTFSNEIFLQKDTGVNDPERIIIFTTKTHLLHLENSDKWNCDGTFYSCPKTFQQLYVIMARVKSIDVPLVYAFMKNKSKSSYYKLFSYIKNNINDKYPEFIIIDFEMAALLAIREIFKYSKTQGCFFHLSQIGFKYVQKFNLSTEYKSNILIRETFRMMLALAFVPIDKFDLEVSKLDLYINQNNDLKTLIPLWIFFKSTYCQSIEKTKVKEISIFSILFWSVHERVLKDQPRTNNALEGWNSSLNNNIFQKNPSLYEIGNELKKHHAIVENKISRLLIKSSIQKNQFSETYNDKIKKIVENYDDYYSLDFLKTIGVILKLKEI
ncbi:hypothetical protein DMUE_0464 [Dictyocoela muelleri]|nr:hypothetical protein DMUE_0464 [Dictyocoela muelleri]